MKEIKTKANDEEVKTELGQVDFKLQTLERATMQNNKDIESLQALLKMYRAQHGV